MVRAIPASSYLDISESFSFVSAEITSALERLTSPQTQYNIPSLAKVTKAVSNTRLRLSNRTQDDSPIPIDVLNKILVVS